MDTDNIGKNKDTLTPESKLTTDETNQTTKSDVKEMVSSLQQSLSENEPTTLDKQNTQDSSPSIQQNQDKQASSQLNAKETVNNQTLPNQVKIIKRYGNRKLYDTEKSSYVVLKDIKKMINDKENIRVIDNETQKDITVATLIQIIFSAEKKSLVSPPLEILHSVIRDGDGGFSSFLAKLGLFTPEVSEKNQVEPAYSSFPAKDYKTKKKKSETLQSEEQKLVNLVNSDETKSNTVKEAVPELPGGLG